MDTLLEWIDQGNVQRFCDYIKSLNNVNSVLVYDDGCDLNLLHIVSGYDSSNRDLMMQNLLNIPLEPYKTGVDVNRKSGPGNDCWTAAHIAACWGHHSTLKLLLDNGAQADILDLNGHNVWDIARAYDNFLCVAVLQQYLYHNQCKRASAPAHKRKPSQPETDLQARLQKLDLSATQSEYYTCDSELDSREEVDDQPTDLQITLTSGKSETTNTPVDQRKHCDDDDQTPVRQNSCLIPINPNMSKNCNRQIHSTHSIDRVRTRLFDQSDDELDVTLKDVQAAKSMDHMDLSCQIDTNANWMTDDESDTLISQSDSPPDADMDLDKLDVPSSDEAFSESADDHNETESSIRQSIISQDTDKSVELYEDFQFGISLLNESRKSTLILANVQPEVSTVNVSKSHLFGNMEQEFEKLDHFQLRSKLIENGMSPGPINDLTKKVYVKKLCILIQRNGSIASPLGKQSPCSSPSVSNSASFSPELNLLINKKFDFSKAKILEQEFQNYFERINCSKVYFTYLLLDPRLTTNLMNKIQNGQKSDAKLFEQFIKSIFYIGKGQGNRPFMHLYEAALLENKNHLKKSITPSQKLSRILDIWNNDQGVVSLHCFHSISSQEALTRECFMINAIGIHNLTNVQIGQNRIKDLLWNDHKKNYFGTYLLYKAFNLYLVNGERQIRKADIQR